MPLTAQRRTLWLGDRKELGWSGIAWSQDGVPPHALTLRGEYLPPSNRRIYITNGYVRLMRSFSPANAGRSRIYSIILGGYGCTASILSPTLGTKDADRVNAGFILAEGGAIEIWTEDASTGGGIDYEASFEVIEYACIIP